MDRRWKDDLLLQLVKGPKTKFTNGTFTKEPKLMNVKKINLFQWSKRTIENIAVKHQSFIEDLKMGRVPNPSYTLQNDLNTIK